MVKSERVSSSSRFPSLPGRRLPDLHRRGLGSVSDGLKRNKDRDGRMADGMAAGGASFDAVVAGLASARFSFGMAAAVPAGARLEMEEFLRDLGFEPTLHFYAAECWKGSC